MARKGRLLGFRGAARPVAAVADEDGARRPTRLGSEEHRVGRKPSGLDPAHRDDRMPDEAVAVVHVEDEGPSSRRERRRSFATRAADAGSLIRRGRLSPASGPEIAGPSLGDVCSTCRTRSRRLQFVGRSRLRRVMSCRLMSRSSISILETRTYISAGPDFDSPRMATETGGQCLVSVPCNRKQSPA